MAHWSGSLVNPIVSSLRIRLTCNAIRRRILPGETRSRRGAWYYIAKTPYSTQTQTPPPRLTRKDYTVGWVCALPFELAAAQEMLDEEHQGLPQDADDSNIYTLGRMGEHNVVIACLPAGQMGNNSAAAVAVQMKSSFNAIRFGLMVGIGGGVPSTERDVRLGDVVVSQPFSQHGGVVQYDFGKTTPSGFTRTGFLNAPPTILLNAVASVRAKHLRRRTDLLTHLSKLGILPEFNRDKAGSDILFEAAYKHAGGAECEECSRERVVDRPPRGQEIMIHYGTIASGNQVMRDGVIRDRVSSELGGVLCFEMEAAGLMNNFPCLVVRGICDYADSHKNKRWQAYAAGTAAACAKEILSVIPAAKVVMEPTADDIIHRKDATHDAHWLVPFERNPHFTGRESQLAQLEERLFVKGQTTKIAITGLGGVGKTQLALELAYRTREKHKNCSVIWIPATNMESLQQAYLHIAQQLGIPGWEQEKADVQKLVQGHLSKESVGQWLLVFDNADDIDMWISRSGSGQRSNRLIECLPRSKKGCIIFTTRDRKTAVKLAQQNVIVVPEMDENMAKLLLQKCLVNPDLIDNEQDTKALLAQLTYLPLAIVQAAAYLNENGITLAEYQSLLAEQEEEVVELLSEEFEHDGRDLNVKSPVATTWLISFEQIRHRDPLAADYLSFMACIDPKNVPQSLLPPGPSRKKEIDAIGTLNAYSFITRRPEDRAVDVHQLVHLATRNWLRKKDLLARWTDGAITRLAEMLTDTGHDDRALWRTYLPHARYALESHLVDKDGEDRIDLVWKYGIYLYHDGRYNEAEISFEQVMERRKKVLSEEHPDMLTSMNYLALTFLNQGRWKEAEYLFVQVIETSKSVLGEEHPDTLASMSNLALTFWNQGRWKEAEELEVQVMETRKRVLGEEHPSTLISMNNLALTFWNQGRWKEAEELEVQVMETSKRVLGEEHPDTLTSMNNLALTFWNQGRWKEAEELEVQVMETRKRVLGEEHPDTLTGTGNLASMFLDERGWKEAEELFVQMIETSKRVLGAEHPDTLTGIANLASTYRGQGRLKEAEELFVQMMEISKRVLGEEHPDMLTGMGNLASTYSNQGRWKEAEELFVQVMETSKRVLGEEHPDTLTNMNNLALTFWNQGRWKEAEELEVQVMETRKRVLGEEHPSTLTSMNNLASTFWNQGRWKEAEELEEQAMETRKRVLGEEHPSTLTSMNNLAFTWKVHGRDAEAIELMKKCVFIQASVLGVDHPNTLSSAATLAGWRGDDLETAAPGTKAP